LDEFICEIELKHTKKRHLVRLLTFIDGEIMGNLKRRNQELFSSFGFVLGRLNNLLNNSSFGRLTGIASSRNLEWDMRNALDFEQKTENIISPKLKEISRNFFKEFKTRVFPIIPNLRKQLIHGDANDYNVVASKEREKEKKREKEKEKEKERDEY